MVWGGAGVNKPGGSAVLKLEIVYGHAAEQRTSMVDFKLGGHGCTRGNQGVSTCICT